jgi:hypothetical protein
MLRDPQGAVNQGLASPNPWITTGEAGMRARRWPLRPVRFHPEGAACRSEAPPRPYLLVAYPARYRRIRGRARLLLPWSLKISCPLWPRRSKATSVLWPAPSGWWIPRPKRSTAPGSRARIRAPPRAAAFKQGLTNFFAVVMEFPNPPGELKEGMTGTARIYGKRYPLDARALRAGRRWARSLIW